MIVMSKENNKEVKWRINEYLGSFNIEIFTEDYGWLTLHDNKGDKPLTFYRKEQCRDFMKDKGYYDLIHI